MKILAQICWEDLFIYLFDNRGKYYLYVEEFKQQQTQKPPKDTVY